MPAGLQTFDKFGNETYNSLIDTTRVLGTLETGTQDGEFPLDVPEGYNIWIALQAIDMTKAPLNNSKASFNFPAVSYDDGKISWHYNSFNVNDLYTYMGLSTTKISIKIIYGVY